MSITHLIVKKIMWNVNYGWLIRYMHAVGASMFFLLRFICIYSVVLFNKTPRELLWQIGLVISLTMIAALSWDMFHLWGQMSYWGANGDH